MNVLIISEYFPSPIRPSSGAFVSEQARELAKIANIMVISPISVPLPRKKFMHERSLKAQIPFEYKMNSIITYYPRYLDFPRFSEYFNAYSMTISVIYLILKKKLKIDIIHAHFAYFSGFVGCLIGKFLHKPVVITTHGFDVNLYLKALPEYQKIYGVNNPHALNTCGRRASWALHKCIHIIAVSDELRNRLIGLGITQEKITTIRNGVDPDLFRPMNQADDRKYLGLPIEAKIILFVGNLQPRKDPTSLILALNILRSTYKNILFLIKGHGKLLESLKRLVNENQLSCAVRFMGVIPYENVPILMNACDVFVLPSLYESFGCVLLEALACGKPIVTTKVGAIPEIFLDEQHGRLIESGDPEGLAHAIISVIDRSWEPQKLVNFAHQHQWREVAQKIYKCYQEIINKK